MFKCSNSNAHLQARKSGALYVRARSSPQPRSTTADEESLPTACTQGCVFVLFIKLPIETVERGAEPRLCVYTQDLVPAFPQFLRRFRGMPDLVGLDAASGDWLTD